MCFKGLIGLSVIVVEIRASPSLFNINPLLDNLEENRVRACWLIWHPDSIVSGEYLAEWFNTALQNLRGDV